MGVVDSSVRTPRIAVCIALRMADMSHSSCIDRRITCFGSCRTMRRLFVCAHSVIAVMPVMAVLKTEVISRNFSFSVINWIAEGGSAGAPSGPSLSTALGDI